MSRHWIARFAVFGSLLLGPISPIIAAPILSVDINSIRGGQPTNPSPTLSAFSAFDADNAAGSPQSALIAGHNITFTALGGASFQTRDRDQSNLGVAGLDFTTSPVGDFYRDSIQADGGTSGSAGINLQVDGLTASTSYDLTLWTHDVFSNNEPLKDTVSIVDVNTTLAIGGGMFPEAPEIPSDLTTSRFIVTATTDANGLLNVDLLHTGGGPDGAFINGAIPLNGFELSEMSSVLLGDLNDDGFVGQDDLNIILGAWGTTVEESGNWKQGDPSDDGFVGQDDLNDVLGGWGQGDAPGEISAVPEPSAILLTIVAMVGWFAVRRRVHG